MSAPLAVDVSGLVKRYGAKAAVDGLSMSAGSGQVTAVLGPNGAGKTTTIETCEGYRRADAGTVRVLGLDPATQAAQLRPRIGVMLQAGGVYPTARAEEMLRHIARLHAHPIDPGLLIERLGLGSAGRTPYRRLSGGQQRRLALAMAVVGRPELVFLDEPTAGLDPQARAATWDLIGALRTDGVTVVLSTHLMDEAERLADRVVIVDGGRVVASGTVDELAADSSAAETLTFDAPAGLELASLRAALPREAAVAEVEPGSYQVSGPITPTLLASLTGWCAEQGVLAQGLSVRRRTLEDVFLDLTGRELRG